MLDSFLRSTPRFLLYMTLEQYRLPLCVPSTDASSFSAQSIEASNLEESRYGDAPGELERRWTQFRDSLSQSTCGKVIWIVQVVFCMAIIALTVLELLTALKVRTYATKLVLMRRMQSRGVLAGEKLRLAVAEEEMLIRL